LVKAVAGDTRDDWPAVKAAVLASGAVIQRDMPFKLRVGANIPHKVPEFDLIVNSFAGWLAERNLPKMTIVRQPHSEPINGVLMFGADTGEQIGTALSACEQFNEFICIIQSKDRHAVSFVIARVDDTGSLNDRSMSVMRALIAAYGVRMGNRGVDFAKNALRFSYDYLKPGMDEAEVERQFRRYWGQQEL